MMENAGWVALGWGAGVLTLMQIQVWKARRDALRDKHPMEYPFNVKPTEEPVTKDYVEWNVSELSAVQLTPREVTVDKPSVLQECPQCGKAYKRVNQHIAMSHKVTTPDEEA